MAEQKLSGKQIKNLHVEGRVMKQLEALKAYGGPFTSVSCVDDFLSNDSIATDEKRKRMKMEVQYARDTSLSIPRCNPIFRIRTGKVSGKKSRDLTPIEYGENIKTLIDKKSKAAGKEVSIDDFIKTLEELL